jgi:hypothetical protein
VIYVEYQEATSQAPNPPEGRRAIGWWAVCDECRWTSGPHNDQDDAIREADQHNLAMGEVTWEELERSSSRDVAHTSVEGGYSVRPAAPGERCTCGRQAVVVYLGSVFGPTGYCGIADGGDRTGPCPFCGGPRHETAWGDPGRCPDYRLRLDQR